jgi:hypothetical protein
LAWGLSAIVYRWRGYDRVIAETVLVNHARRTGEG